MIAASNKHFATIRSYFVDEVNCSRVSGLRKPNSDEAVSQRALTNLSPGNGQVSQEFLLACQGSPSSKGNLFASSEGFLAATAIPSIVFIVW